MCQTWSNPFHSPESWRNGRRFDLSTTQGWARLADLKIGDNPVE